MLLVVLLACLVLTGANPACAPACKDDVNNSTACHMIPVACLDMQEKLDVAYSKCHYGETVTFNYTYKEPCQPHIPEHCKETTQRDSQCRHCFQMEEEYYSCKIEPKDIHACDPRSSASSNMITVQCEVNPEVFCHIPRIFYRKVACSFTTGKNWGTALVLSITLGGFGADRFYLGFWRHGLGKLFTFGGLGVWTIVDIILISVGYVAPADNSLYILT